MATEPATKEKKRSALRARFLMSNSSLEISSSSTAADDGTSEAPTNQSRVRRLLFRRARSETEARSKTNDVPIDGQIAMSHATVNESASRLLMNPTSPPPPYDGNSEASSSRSGSICPPSYDEAVASSALLTSLPEESGAGPLAGYCHCRECLMVRSSSPENEEEPDDSSCAADAVFPMETHVLMQEVLADGMAFCSVM